MLNRVIASIAIVATAKCVHLYTENRELRRAAAVNQKRFDFVKNVALYMMEELDRHEIEYDEFDEIVIESYKRELEEST